MGKYCVLTLSKFGDQLDRLLTSIRLSHPELALDDIYVVDDGLDSATIEKWEINYIPGVKPFIFARNFNIGVKAIPSDKDVFFAGDDVALITPNAINILAKDVYGIENIMMASPGIQGGAGNFYQNFGNLNRVTRRADLVDLPHYTPTLVFVCVYIRRALIDKIGPIPEELVGYGYEDNYYSMKMIDFHYDWVIDPNVLVIHGWEDFAFGASYQRSGMNVRKLTAINQKIYEKLVEDLKKSI